MNFVDPNESPGAERIKPRCAADAMIEGWKP
jgi:hypothetical protein